jgi:hypothetical protein
MLKRERQKKLYELLSHAIFRSLLPQRRIEVRFKQEIYRENLIEIIIRNIIVEKKVSR